MYLCLKKGIKAFTSIIRILVTWYIGKVLWNSGSPSDQWGYSGKHRIFSHPGAVQGCPNSLNLTSASLQLLSLHQQSQDQKSRKFLWAEPLVPISWKGAFFAALVWCNHKLPFWCPAWHFFKGYLLNSIRMVIFLAVQCLRLGTECQVREMELL